MMRFSRTARLALSVAQRTAVIEQVATIDNRHLLLGLADGSADASTAAHVLNGLGLTAESLGAPEIGPSGSSVHPELSDGIKRALERAVARAQQRGDKLIASAHLLSSLLEDVEVRAALEAAGAPAERVQTALDSLDDWSDES